MSEAANFYTTFLVNSPLFTSPRCNRDPRYLEPTMRRIVAEMMAEAESDRTPIMLIETYRSQARQHALYVAHATQLPTVGCHAFGLAADFAKDVLGYPSWKGNFDFLVKLANKHGLVSGGPGHGNLDIEDFGHCQRCAFDDQVYLFTNEFYPSDPAYVAWQPNG